MHARTTTGSSPSSPNGSAHECSSRRPVSTSRAHQLDDYIAGRRRRFDLALDLQHASGFRVLERLGEVEYGSTSNYSILATAAGSPRAVRAVGTACATNPVPIVVPCHRVVRSDGTVGQYVGGADAKRALLALEAR